MHLDGRSASEGETRVCAFDKQSTHPSIPISTPGVEAADHPSISLWLFSVAQHNNLIDIWCWHLVATVTPSRKLFLFK